MSAIGGEADSSMIASKRRKTETRGAEGYAKLRRDSSVAAVLSSRREVPWGWPGSAPAEARGDMFDDRLDDVGVIVDTKLVRDGQEQCVSICDSFVFRELLD